MTGPKLGLCLPAACHKPDVQVLVAGSSGGISSASAEELAGAYTRPLLGST
jgi:hypothetical protein